MSLYSVATGTVNNPFAAQVDAAQQDFSHYAIKVSFNDIYLRLIPTSETNRGFMLHTETQQPSITLLYFCRLTESNFRLISLLVAASGVSCSIMLSVCFRDLVHDLKIQIQ